jgi:putative ABC transport system permease protein
MDANFSKAVCDRDRPERLAGCKEAATEVIQRMREIPECAAVTSGVPLMPWSILFNVRIQGQTQEISLNGGAFVADRLVSGDYFRALGIQLLAGRTFTDTDTSSSQRVAIVDEAFARKYVGNNALGSRTSTHNDDKDQPIWMEVVGVAGSAHDTEIGRSPTGEIYLPFFQVDYFQEADFVARTSSDPMVMAPALRRSIWSVDKNVPITDLMTMDQVVALSASESRYQAMLLSAFGTLGLILAMVGIYGLISYLVSQRTRELGVRIALGARPQNILRMIISEGMLLVVAGVIIGVAGALALTRFLRSLLFEIKPTDPVTFVGVAISLTLVALAACYIPARRAMRVDPIVALRYE